MLVGIFLHALKRKEKTCVRVYKKSEGVRVQKMRAIKKTSIEVFVLPKQLGIKLFQLRNSTSPELGN